jgi:hypothetical protein
MNTFIRINIVTEGQTEETFVRDVLEEPMAWKLLGLTPRSVETGRHRGQIFRGGLRTYAKARGDIVRWLNSDPTAYVTTMFDLYGLPADFPGRSDASLLGDPYRKAELIECHLAEDIANDRFIPYVQLHEFEGLLFSQVAAIDEALALISPRSRLRELEEIRAAVNSPEEINDDERTAPSKRLLALHPGYDKPLFGSLIAQRIGVDKIRSQCPHFNAWLSRLEALASA